MARKGFFEIEPAPGKLEGISVRIEPGADGDVWMTVNDIVKAYGVFYQTVRAGLKALKKSGDFDEYNERADMSAVQEMGGIATCRILPTETICLVPIHGKGYFHKLKKIPGL